MKQILLFMLLLSGCLISAQEKLTIYFDLDIAEANLASQQSLDNWIEQHKEAEVLQIYGYTDAVGTVVHNQELSEKRAAYVYGKFKMAGLNVVNVHEQGFGETKAAGGNNHKERRVEVYYRKPEPASKLSETVSKSKVGDKLRLPNLNFYNHSDNILPQSEPVLKELLEVMKANPNLKIDIQGHICCQPVDVSDIAIKRAKAVYNYLKQNGIEGKRISYRSFGSTKPLHPLPENSEEERVANRRVEIEILQN